VFELLPHQRCPAVAPDGCVVQVTLPKTCVIVAFAAAGTISPASTHAKISSFSRLDIVLPPFASCLE
jgi:hypothetical protein